MKKTFKYILPIIMMLSINNANSGVPVIEETSVVFQPLSYIEQLQTQLNTINQYEQMILDYETQLNQLQQMMRNTNFDNISLNSIEELQSTLNLMKSKYQNYVNQYNTLANRSNKLLDEGCDFLKNYDVCAEQQKEELNNLAKELTESNQKAAEDNDENRAGSTAKKIKDDSKKLEKLISAKNYRVNEGTNQILADQREMGEFTNTQLLELRNQTQDIKNLQTDMKNYWMEKEVLRKKMIQDKYRSKEAHSWSNKIYQDHY